MLGMLQLTVLVRLICGRFRARMSVPVLATGHAAARGRHLFRGMRSTLHADAGMSTAEYAVGTVAAVAFAVVLYKVVSSSAVMSALSSVIRGALSVHLG